MFKLNFQGSCESLLTYFVLLISETAVSRQLGLNFETSMNLAHFLFLSGNTSLYQSHMFTHFS